MSERVAVLVVDDNRELAENIAEILAFDDVRSTVVTGGSEALETLERTHFDMVITDVRMPGMNGVELLRNIHQRWPAMPIVVMSAYSSDAVLEEAAVEGALDVLVKPLDFDRIIDLVRRVAEPRAPVLLVEDNDALRVSLSDCLLDLAGVIPYPARDIAAATRLMATIPFRLAIVDLRLPDGDGLTLGRALKERFGQLLTLVYVTAYLSENHAELEIHLRDTRSPRLLEKPFSPARLLDLVSSIIAQSPGDADEPNAG